MRKGTCKHFNGTWHNTRCEAGVCYSDVIPRPEDGPAVRINQYHRKGVAWDGASEGETYAAAFDILEFTDGTPFGVRCDDES